ncbi:McrB family protein [Staphylococcus simulans]|uniref:McrB family protein n=1 Tax=Staphylococcus simulans TaxID=1286 RepID=UPI0021D475E7|nr:AAA family ATPase [Staphylococcus simulans]UXR33019.1 AAA family ATPase [Staphylococcus simulans]
MGNIYNISKEVEDAPQLIFYKDENYNIYVIGDLNGFKYQGSKGFAYDFSEEIKYVNLNENDYKKLCLTKDNIAYISTELSRNIEEKLNFEKKNKIEVNKEDDLKAVKKEEEFLNHFIETLKRNRLVYDEEDILNFHTAMKTSNLVILSGMSGTGKSKLVKAYADALSLKDSFKFIPVSPSWTEDSDIIGYADTLNMVYRPDDYGLIDLLINAKENPDKLFIVCFDEMNLARIEHYFSQFLSLLETDVESRRLSLYNRELGGKLYNSSKYSYQIPIGRNVKFVGTANIDDSTYNFSNKVLDRSNLITLKVMPFKDLVKLSKRDNTTNFNDEEFDKIYVDYFSNSKKEIELDERTVEFLQKFHDLLSQVHKEMGIGPRILKQIDLYLKNIPVNSISFTKKEGLDLQVVQRILTKVRGSSEELEKLLGIYDSDGTVTSSEILSLFEEFEDVSNFTNSEKVIKQKAKELNLNGYTF